MKWQTIALKTFMCSVVLAVPILNLAFNLCARNALVWLYTLLSCATAIWLIIKPIAPKNYLTWLVASLLLPTTTFILLCAIPTSIAESLWNEKKHLEAERFYKDWTFHGTWMALTFEKDRENKAIDEALISSVYGEHSEQVGYCAYERGVSTRAQSQASMENGANVEGAKQLDEAKALQEKAIALTVYQPARVCILSELFAIENEKARSESREPSKKELAELDDQITATFMFYLPAIMADSYFPIEDVAALPDNELLKDLKRISTAVRGTLSLLQTENEDSESSGATVR